MTTEKIASKWSNSVLQVSVSQQEGVQMKTHSDGSEMSAFSNTPKVRGTGRNFITTFVMTFLDTTTSPSSVTVGWGMRKLLMAPTEASNADWKSVNVPQHGNYLPASGALPS
jgi:hypothetical protein